MKDGIYKWNRGVNGRYAKIQDGKISCGRRGETIEDARKAAIGETEPYYPQCWTYVAPLIEDADYEALWNALYYEEPEYTPVRVGDRFLINGGMYLLACVDCGKVNLIELGTGLRWTEPEQAINPFALTLKEFKELLDDLNNSKWKKIYKTRIPLKK